MSRCRSCEAEIIWCVTDNDKRIPVDAHPAAGGNIRLHPGAGRIPAPGQPPIARVVGTTIDLTDDTDDGTRYYPHHATCPEGPQWKRKK